MASAPRSYSLWVRHNYDIRRFVVFDGYPIAEFEAVLQASFDEDARIFGGTTSDGTQMVPLAVLCANPSFKVRADHGAQRGMRSVCGTTSGPACCAALSRPRRARRGPPPCPLRRVSMTCARCLTLPRRALQHR